MPDPWIVGALILIAAILVVNAAFRFLGLRGRVRRWRGGATHSMGRDETVSYFRDFGDSSGAPGVREEDRAERWGKGDDQSR